MKQFTSKTQKTGKIGEDIAVNFLKTKGYKVLTRNYTKKWGEIDIVALNKGVLHFIEVKSKSVTTLNSEFSREKVIRETEKDDVSREKSTKRPEENVHPQKVKRLRRVIDTYLSDSGVNKDWQFDIISLYLDFSTKEAKMEFIKDIVI